MITEITKRTFGMDGKPCFSIEHAVVTCVEPMKSGGMWLPDVGSSDGQDKRRLLARLPSEINSPTIQEREDTSLRSALSLYFDIPSKRQNDSLKCT